MQVYFSDAQLSHDPQQFMVAGRLVSPVEIPERARRLAHRYRDMGLDIAAPCDTGLAPINAVHPTHYTDFLQSAYERFQALPAAGPEALPNVHPHVSAGPGYTAREKPRPTSVVGQVGWYMGDMACAIGPGTWTAALASAQTAVCAAQAVRDGAYHALALCRPPGHHAYADRASGFCFLNNAAIAVEVLRKTFARVAVLDFDTHHGDGTQAIFFRRGDVFVASCHTDPSEYYPFYAGYADETGFAEGDKANLNIPLAQGSGDEAFLDANRAMIVAALAFDPDVLVISAGWDAHRDDPLSRLAVSTSAYRQLGRLIGDLPLPVVLVQEGGYSLTAIETAAPLFVTEFLDERRFV